MANEVLLKLPHRQFVFTLPKALRIFLKHEENFKTFDAIDFIAEVTAHIPPKHKQYIRRYGLYSSRIRGIWDHFSHLVRLAPQGWKEKHKVGQETGNESLPSENTEGAIEPISSGERASAWARLIKSSTLPESNCN